MKRVYVVIAGYDYEGYSASSLKVFTLRASAEAYANEITKGEWPYDHATVMEQGEWPYDHATVMEQEVIEADYKQ